MNKTYYKVLVGGRSCHAGNFAYSLPHLSEDGAWAPGEWHEHNGWLDMCHAGFHLTDTPARWWKHEAQCFEAEYEGALQNMEDKIVCRRVRLLRQLSSDELQALNIFIAGEHSIQPGYTAAADGNSTVRADGNSTVEAYGNSTVEAYGNSTVRADGNSTVRAYSNSTVRAYSNSTVRAYSNSTVRADGNSTVEAYGNSTVRAYGNSTVEAYGNSTVRAYGETTINIYRTAGTKTPTVKLKGNAVLIDRTTGKPQITTA